MSEIAGNVTSGIAMRNPVFPPESKQKKFSEKELNMSIEDAIDKTIENSAKKNITKILETDKLKTSDDA